MSSSKAGAASGTEIGQRAKAYRPSSSKKGRMTLALRDAERALRAIQTAGFTGDARDSWRYAKAWLEKHADLLATLQGYEEDAADKAPAGR